MTPERAVELIAQLQTASAQMSSLLLEAFEGRIWETVGCGSWRTFVSEYLVVTYNRAAQLLDMGRVERVLAEHAADTPPPRSERETRVLNRLVRMDPTAAATAWRTAVARSGGEQPSLRCLQAVVSTMTTPGEAGARAAGSLGLDRRAQSRVRTGVSTVAEEVSRARREGLPPHDPSVLVADLLAAVEALGRIPLDCYSAELLDALRLAQGSLTRLIDCIAPVYD